MTVHPPSRQTTGEVRDRTPLAVHASRIARRFVADNGRGLVIAAIVGLFLAVSGAFNTGPAPLGLRLAYWVGVMVGGALVGGGVSDIFRAYGWWEDNPVLHGVVLALTISLPLTLLIWPLTCLVYGLRPAPDQLLYFFPIVLLVSVLMTALNYVAARKPPVTHAAPAGAAPPRFLDRLPLKLRGAEVWAVEAEDHYLRLHTSRGQDLILMRLSDAVAELEGLEGAQTHRSWWVARAAVTDARRGDGRAVLTLKDGAQVPVSRAYAKALRESGWY